MPPSRYEGAGIRIPCRGIFGQLQKGHFLFVIGILGVVGLIIQRIVVVRRRREGVVLSIPSSNTMEKGKQKYTDEGKWKEEGLNYRPEQQGENGSEQEPTMESTNLTNIQNLSSIPAEPTEYSSYFPSSTSTTTTTTSFSPSLAETSSSSGLKLDIPRRRSYTKTITTSTSTIPNSIGEGQESIGEIVEVSISGEILTSPEGWRRHTRVFGGGVCKACEESEMEMLRRGFEVARRSMTS